MHIMRQAIKVVLKNYNKVLGVCCFLSCGRGGGSILVVGKLQSGQPLANL